MIAYAREHVSDSGKILPDLRTEGSGFIRLTNYILVAAIDNGFFEFEIPPDTGSPLASILEAHFQDIRSPKGQDLLLHCVRRLAVMTTPVTGTIPVVYNDDHYNIFVEFSKTADDEHRVRVKINTSIKAEE